MNGIINEIVNLFVGESSVQYRHQANQRKALLVKIPQVTSHKNFKHGFCGKRAGKESTAFETFLSFLCKEEVALNEENIPAIAAYLLCHYLFDLYDSNCQLQLKRNH